MIKPERKQSKYCDLLCEKGNDGMNNRNKIAGILVGLGFVAVGVYLFGWAAGFWDYFLFEGWWTLFLIVPGVALMIRDGVNMGNTILTVIGVLLLLNEQGVFHRVSFWPIVWAALLICAGIGIISGQFKHRFYFTRGNSGPYGPDQPGSQPNPPVSPEDAGAQNGASSQEAGQQSSEAGSSGAQGSAAGAGQAYQNSGSYQNVYGNSEDYPVHTAVFSGLNIKNHSLDLKGADLTAIFGGIDMDFSQSRVNRNIVIKSYAVFGGVDIIAPRGVKVQVDAFSLFGGYDNKVVNPAGDNLPVVVVKASSIFGGVEIK